METRFLLTWKKSEKHFPNVSTEYFSWSLSSPPSEEVETQESSSTFDLQILIVVHDDGRPLSWVGIKQLEYFLSIS